MNPKFTVSKFENMISRRGRPFRWERARRCPCFNPQTRSPRETCIDCAGIGWVYRLIGTYTATILGITGSKQWAKFGEWLEGDAIMTFPSALGIGDKDRITLTTGDFRESELLTKGETDVLLNQEVVSIIECADEDTTYEEGLDFHLDGATIVWVGSQPADGVQYSVLYTARPVYVVWLQLPQIRAQVTAPDSTGTPVVKEMPKKVALRRWMDFTRPAG